MRACNIKTLRSHGIQESAHLVFFTWSLLYLTSDWFSENLFTSVNALTILAFLIEAAALHGSMILFWISHSISGSSWGLKSRGSDFTNRFINPFNMFTFHRDLKIRILRPRNRTAFTRTTIRHIYLAKCTHVWRIGSHDQNRSVNGECLKTVFPAKKGTKRRSEAPCDCFSVLPEALRRYSEKVTFYLSFKQTLNTFCIDQHFLSLRHVSVNHKHVLCSKLQYYNAITSNMLQERSARGQFNLYEFRTKMFCANVTSILWTYN